LTRETLQQADRHARLGDVTGVERVIRRALNEDDRLGQRRPQEMASLLAMLDSKLDSARRLRLARDSWVVRVDLLRRYRLAVEESVSLMRLSSDSLDEIRRLAGPSPTRLVRLARRTTRAGTLLAGVSAPLEASAAHGLLKNAIGLASRAAESRRRALMTGEMPPAWEASSAAAGALLLFDRASEELRALQTPPKAIR
jgi:hypothetical protein